MRLSGPEAMSEQRQRIDKWLFFARVVKSRSRRGPYEEAKLLYEDISPPPVTNKEKQFAGHAIQREAGSGRPTKRERRVLDKWNSSGD